MSAPLKDEPGVPQTQNRHQAGSYHFGARFTEQSGGGVKPRGEPNYENRSQRNEKAAAKGRNSGPILVTADRIQIEGESGHAGNRQQPVPLSDQHHPYDGEQDDRSPTE